MTTNSRLNKIISISYVSRFLFACLIACAGLAGLYAQTARERAAEQPVDLGQKAIRRMIAGQSFAVHTFGVLPFAGPLTTTNDSWNGAAGNWNATTWSLGVMPGSGNNALITNSGGQVQLNVSDTIVNLTIGGGNLLNFQNGNSLTVTGNTITNSNSTGSGGITLSSSNSTTQLLIGSAAVSLTGGGTLTMGNNANNRIMGSVATDVLTNVNNIIQGSGNIGAGQMGLVNQLGGTIDANQTTPLYIQTSNGTTNAGTLEATAGGNLVLYGDTYTNTGTILASGSGSVVTLENSTVNGGTLNAGTGASIQASGTNTLNGVTIVTTGTGAYQVNNGQTTDIEGTITNNGAVQLNSTNSTTQLVLSGSNVTLAGTGTLTMGNNSNNRIIGAVAADVLTNSSTIVGSGDVGAGQMGLINHGTIDANQATPLYVQTSNGTTNTGTLEATAGGNLILDGDVYTNATGTILATGTNSVVTLLNPTINGGTLQTALGGIFSASGTPTLNGVTITGTGTYQIGNGQSTQLEGTLTNSSTIQLNSSNSATELQANGAVTLNGGGAVTLTDNNNNYILQSVSGSSFTNFNNTISGSGNIGNGAMAFINDAGGVVDALSSHSNSLTISTGAAGATNLGLMEAGNGGTLVLDNAIANTNGTTNGTIEALNGGTVILNNATVSGGIITTAAASTGVVLAENSSELNGTTNAVTNNGNLQVPNGQTLYITGTLTNNGTLDLNSSNSATELQVNSTTAILQGTGSVTFTDNNNNYIFAAAGGDQLTIKEPISGAGGNIGNGDLVIVNLNTIDATVSAHGNALTIQPDGLTNTGGILEATGGGVLTLDGSTITNTGGNIIAGTGSTVNLNGSVDIVGGTLSGAGTINANSGSQLDGAVHAVTNSSNIVVNNGNTAYMTGTLINNGTLSINSSNSATEFQINSATATISGTGSITFTDNDNNYIFAASSGEQLTLAEPLNAAGGNIGNGDLVLVNQSTIDATASAHGNVLTIQPDATFSNAGLLEATGGGVLALDGGTFTNTGTGSISSAASSDVVLEGSVTITGGTLAGAGVFTSNNGTTLNSLTNASTVVVPNGSNLYLEGTIANTGALQLNSSNSDTFIYPSGAVTLTGAGTLTLTDNNNNYIQEAVSNSSLTNVNNTISGSGNLGNGNLAFTNQTAGVVDATSSHGNVLIVDSPSGVNAGLFEASSGGTLELENILNNTGGTIEGLAGTGSSAGGSVVINGAAITGGTLNTLGTGVNASSMSFYNGAILNGVTNLGTIGLPNGNTAYLEGTVTNNGSIQVNSSNSNTFLYMDGNVTLNGTGNITLTNNSANYIYGSAGTEILTNNGNTIEGGGHIGNGTLGLINNAGGTILANQPVELIIQPNSNGVTNNGTFQVNTGSTLDVTGGLFNNFNSGTGTLTGGTYNVNGGTFQFDSANIVTNAADIILTGASSQIISNTSANALANFATNAAGGVFQLGAGRSFTTSAPGGGNFTNDGTLIVGGGDTFQVAGALSNFAGTTLSGGTYYVAGTLQFGASGSHLVTNSANLTLAGASPHLLDLGGNNLLTGFNDNASGATFTIAAAGNYSTPGNFTNAGTMDVEQASTLKVSGNLTNTGTVATNLTNLKFGANTLTVTGTLTNSTAGTVSIGENNDTSDVANVGLLANSGAVTVGTGATLNLTSSGTDTNSGAITADGGTLDMQAGSFTNSTGGTMDLEQKGTLTVTGNLTNSGAITTNKANLGGAANTITVTGTLTNNTGGSVTIGENGDTTDTASVGLLSNAGTVAVDKGATLKLTATGADSNTGAITATGGTLTIASGNAFTNSTGGTLDLESGGKLSVTGNLTNSGSLSTNIANLGGAANTIAISGKLTNNTGATLTVGANGDTTDTASVGLLANGGTVAVDKGATLKMTATGADANSGSITATGGTVSVASGGAFTNSTGGTLDLESGGKLNVTGGLTNAGTLTTNVANLGGAANSITISGALTNNTGATVIVGDNNDTTDTASIGSLANSGAVTVGTGATLELSTAATDTNAGTIAVNGTLDIKSATTLSGAGTLTLTNGAITGLGATGPAFTNSSTIQGSGTISNLGITNAGTLTANQSAALVILPTTAGLDNTGTINVAAGDTMQIGTSAGGALTNFSGTTLTGGTYNVTGTLQFGVSGTTIATNAATITLSGTGKMIDFGSNNILAGFKDNSATGVFKMASGATLTTTGGSFTNAGTFVAGTGTTFTVGGSSFNFIETGGSAQVNGTLTSSTLGTLAINGGTVDGTGTLGYNVVDSSVLTPGDSATVTGKLTVTDTYTQHSTGALDIQINGATAGTNYDILKVNQTATLGGTLNITLGSFTPTVGETFTILTASSVSDTFATVNGLAINGSEHFTITYNAGSVVLTVASGALVTSGPASGVLTRLIPAPVRHGSGREGRYGLGIFEPKTARVPALVPGLSMARRPVALPTSSGQPAAGMGQLPTMAHGFGMAHTAAGPIANAPIAWPVSFAIQASGLHGFKPMDQFGAPSLGSAPASAGDGSAAGSFGISATSAAAYNSMGAMNHMRFECGLDLKAAMKTSRKKLWKGLWAAPDSPDALYLGYMSYTASH